MTNPTAAGCSVVLPTLATCIANPAAAGCSAVLPPLATCVTDPTLPGCSSPTLQKELDVIVTGVNLAQQTIVDTTIITSTKPSDLTGSGGSSIGGGDKTSSGSGGSTGGSSSSSSDAAGQPSGVRPKEDKEDENKDDKTVVAKDSGAKKDEPVRKLYCN